MSKLFLFIAVILIATVICFKLCLFTYMWMIYFFCLCHWRKENPSVLSVRFSHHQSSYFLIPPEIKTRIEYSILPRIRYGFILRPILRNKNLSSSVMVSKSIGSSDGSKFFCIFAKAFSANTSFPFAYNHLKLK